MAADPRVRFRNRILSLLSSQEREILLPHLTFTDLPQGMVLRKPGSEDKFVYFIETGMASATALSMEGDSVEVGLSGREGLVGISSLLGHPGMPHHVVMQGAGSGFSIETEIVRTEFRKGGPLMTAVHDFMHAQLVQAAQCALCNRVHGLTPRMARWLLTAADVMETSVLHLTQEFLAQMIGAERSSVTLTAGLLQQGGMIQYRRGLVEITNRPMLEDAACECYGLLHTEYARIFGWQTEPARKRDASG